MNNQIYVHVSTGKIRTVAWLIKQNPGVAVPRGVTLNPDQIEALGGAMVAATTPGDVATGNAVLVDDVWYVEYRDFNKSELTAQAKEQRTANKFAPISVDVSAGDGKVFDLDEESQSNIKNTIEEWPVIDVVSGGHGVIPWTLADNTEILVTLDDLKAVKTAGVLRGLAEHQKYQAVKNS